MKSHTEVITIILLVAASLPDTILAQDQLKNVLFMPVDDLRPEIFAGYNQQYIKTPKLDKLIKESLVFQRAYCQHALCIPSRNSFMTGQRLDTTKVWAGLGVHDFRVTGPDWISLPGHFKKMATLLLEGERLIILITHQTGMSQSFGHRIGLTFPFSSQNVPME